MINWTVRIKNKTFWIALIPAVLLLIQALAKMVGIEIEVEGLQENVLEVVNTMFAILAIVGVVSDPTTEGCTDSLHVMGYTCPVNKKEELAEMIGGDTEETEQAVEDTATVTETEQAVEDTVAETSSEAEVAAETTTTTTTKKTTTETVEEGESNE